MSRDEAFGQRWGDKGCVYDPSKCQHAPDDGCEWCCMECNTDAHRCPACGTVSDHKNTPCDATCNMAYEDFVRKWKAFEQESSDTPNGLVWFG